VLFAGGAITPDDVVAPDAAKLGALAEPRPAAPPT
jgi:hypothetical protein